MITGLGLGLGCGRPPVMPFLLPVSSFDIFKPQKVGKIMHDHHQEGSQSLFFSGVQTCHSKRHTVFRGNSGLLLIDDYSSFGKRRRESTANNEPCHLFPPLQIDFESLIVSMSVCQSDRQTDLSVMESANFFAFTPPCYDSPRRLFRAGFWAAQD